MMESSFIKAIFKSLWVFSITLAASAILMDFALTTSALIIDWYYLQIFSKVFGVSPDTTFAIFVRV